MVRVRTTKSFIVEATKKHGDAYDYSKVVYVKSDSEVNIICPKPGHGEFKQKPNKHLKGQGCKKCGEERRSKSRRRTTQSFIQDAIKKHGTKYDYSKVNYTLGANTVTIICPIDEHGEFYQSATSHLGGSGCHKCAGKHIMTQDEFIERSIKKHGNKYDYSKVEYTHSEISVVITCGIDDHGDFNQVPKNHYNGSGCPKCKSIKHGDRCRSTKSEFIDKAITIHGDKYDYSKVEYIDSKTYIVIICPVDSHGKKWLECS